MYLKIIHIFNLPPHFAHITSQTLLPPLSRIFFFSLADMYMDNGFISTFGSSSNNQPCLNLFFRGWTLDGPLKFTLACFAVIMFGIGIEGFSFLRKRYHFETTRRMKQMRRGGRSKDRSCSRSELGSRERGDLGTYT